jgi:hypothetical protein
LGRAAGCLRLSSLRFGCPYHCSNQFDDIRDEAAAATVFFRPL